MKTLLIIGGSSTAIEIRECADLFYRDKFEHIYNVIGDTETSSLPNVIHDCDIDKFIVENDIAFIIGFTNQKLRRLFNDKLSQCTPVSIVHPTAVVSPSANIGVGTYVAATAVVSSNAVIGNGCIINIGASIGHDAIIGDNCIIGLNSVVMGRIPDNSVAAGCPAKVVCSLDEYYDKMKKLSMEEAFANARSIQERFNRKPVPADLLCHVVIMPISTMPYSLSDWKALLSLCLQIPSGLMLP